MEGGGGWWLSRRFQTHRWGSDKPVKMMSVKRRSAGWRLLLTLLIGTSASLPVHLSITLMQLCPPAKPCRGPHWADGGWPAAHRGGRPIMPQGWEEDLLEDEDWIIIEHCNFWECLKTKFSRPDLANLSGFSGRLRSMWWEALRRHALDNSGIHTDLSLHAQKQKTKKQLSCERNKALLCQRGR